MVKRTWSEKFTLSLTMPSFFPRGPGAVKPGTPNTGTELTVVLPLASLLGNRPTAVLSSSCSQEPRTPQPASLITPRLTTGAKFILKLNFGAGMNFVGAPETRNAGLGPLK